MTRYIFKKSRKPPQFFPLSRVGGDISSHRIGNQAFHPRVKQRKRKIPNRVALLRSSESALAAPVEMPRGRREMRPLRSSDPDGATLADESAKLRRRPELFDRYRLNMIKYFRGYPADRKRCTGSYPGRWTCYGKREYLVSLAADPLGELHVTFHDGHRVRMDRTKVCVFEQTDEICLRCLLECRNRRRLETEVASEPGGNLTNKSLEGELSNQQIRRLLVLPDLSQGNCARTEPMLLLSSLRINNWCRLPSSLRAQ
jgi:hypothetical protein